MSPSQRDPSQRFYTTTAVACRCSGLLPVARVGFALAAADKRRIRLHGFAGIRELNVLANPRLCYVSY